MLNQAWLESDGVYGYRKLMLDMRGLGETCSRHRVAKLLRSEGLKARGYGRRPRMRGGAPAVVAPNLLAQQFRVNAPNKVWVTDITYIQTHKGWLYLATVIDLFSRQVVGWATGSRIDTQLPLDALHMALWRRKPCNTVTVLSNQGCQFTSHEWQQFLARHNQQPSASRRGNCHDNAVGESVFQLLKLERIRRKIYLTRQEAHSDDFSYIEMFYNPIFRHSSADGWSPIEFERRNSVRLAAIWEKLVDSQWMDVTAEATDYENESYWAMKDADQKPKTLKNCIKPPGEVCRKAKQLASQALRNASSKLPGRLSGPKIGEI